MNTQQIQARAQKLKPRLKRLFERLRKMSKSKVDALFGTTHEEVFASTNCLDCANCCKTTGPLFTGRDIARISKNLRLSKVEFEKTYLKIDEEGDWVLQSVPCPFLGTDNHCSIYEIAPKACRTYPHTDRHKQHQLFQKTKLNAAICPAVQDILEKIEKEINQLN